MGVNVYDVGDVVRLTNIQGSSDEVPGAGFTNASDAAFDPTRVVVKVRKPDGSEQTYQYLIDASVVRDATGKYHYDQPINRSREWTYRWVGYDSSGNTVAAKENTFLVRESAFKRPI